MKNKRVRKTTPPEDSISMEDLMQALDYLFKEGFVETIEPEDGGETKYRLTPEGLEKAQELLKEKDANK